VEVGAFLGLADRTAVLSTHLDDGVLSLGAMIAAGTEGGADVRIITVLAGDPHSAAPAGSWDRSAGFRTEGEAAEARRREDVDACATVGATPVWLPFGDLTYGRRASDSEIWRAVLEAIGSAGMVLVPGFPLVHPDHAWLAALALTERELVPRCALYVEQPYAYHLGPFEPATELPSAIRTIVGGPVTWQPLETGRKHRRAKRRAMRAYRSQLRLLSSGRFLDRRISSFENRNGGEVVAVLPKG
jgi:LmbE family N-acetylglucosaminyl deacetylase